MSFSVTILGSSSAKPTLSRHPSAQAVNVHEQYYLVDAGEGVQQQLIRCGINPLKLRAVFISHLHGDHVFGLFPLISTLALYGRKTPLRVFAPAPFGEILACHLRFFDSELPYPVVWTEVDTTKHALLLENRTLEVWSIPLRHRVPTAGFLFREKEPPLNVEKFKIAKYGLTVAQIRGADLPPLCAPVVRLPLGHQLLGEGRDAGQGRGPDVPRGDLRRRRTENGQGAGPLDKRRRGQSRPKGRSQAADNRTLFVPLQERKHIGRRGPRDLPGDLSGHRRRHLHHRETTMTKAEIQLVRALADKRGRTEHGLFVAEGEKLIGELRGSHLKVRKIFALEGVFAGPEVETVAPRDMERLSLLKTAANSLAIVETPRYGLDMRSLAGRLTLALDDVQNPGNLGTIVRLADWFGIADIVCSEASADCFNPKVVQATMGAILRVRVHYTDLGAFLHDAGAAGLPVYGTFLEGENIYGTTLTEEGVVVMGNEGRGISQAAARAVTHKLFIPPYPADRRGSESLNVAMATGIVCSEFRRRAGMGSGK